jgi:hypothetical protein
MRCRECGLTAAAFADVMHAFFAEAFIAGDGMAVRRAHGLSPVKGNPPGTGCDQRLLPVAACTPPPRHPSWRAATLPSGIHQGEAA